MGTSKTSEKGIVKKVRDLTPTQKILVYLVVVIAVYGTAISIDNLVLHDIMPLEDIHPDLPRYRDRAQTILEGGLLYRDVHTETPPLINYLFVIPQALGGGSNEVFYSGFFAFFAFLGGVLLYWGLRRFDEYYAFLVGLLYLVIPFGVVESALTEDEIIVTFFVLLPTVLMLMQRTKLSALIIGLGIWVKMFPLILFPVQLIRAKSMKERAMDILIVLGVAALVAGPFIILCWEDFSYFLNFYFLGNQDRGSGGVSFWHFLEMSGLDVPNLLKLALMGTVMVLAYYGVYKMKLGPWQSVLLVVSAFFIIYPKIHTGYYLMPVALLLPWGVKDRKMLLVSFLLYIPIMISVGFAETEHGTPPYFDYEWGWAVGLLVSIVTNLLLIWLTWRALNSKPFFEDSKETVSAEPA